ncbi:unnamed protein product [Sphagnum jensenii]
MSEQTANTEAQVDVTDDLDAFAKDFFGQKSAPAAKQEQQEDAKLEQEDQTETEADSSSDVQNTELTDEDEAEAEAELAKPAPKKSKVQERIDELVKQREDLKRESERQLELVRKEFEAKLEALKPQQTAKTATDEPSPDALNEDGSPKYALGEFDPTYIRDLTRYTLEQERTQANIRAEQERQMRAQQEQESNLQKSWVEKLETSKQKYPDLIEKAQPLLDGFSSLNPDYANYLATVLKSMEYGPDVLYYLSNNAGEARTIVNSGAQKATLALGRIEAKFAEAEAQKLVAKPKISKAPPPPTASARGTGGSKQSVPPDTDDLDAFESMFFSGKRRI